MRLTRNRARNPPTPNFFFSSDIVCGNIKEVQNGPEKSEIEDREHTTFNGSHIPYVPARSYRWLFLLLIFTLCVVSSLRALQVSKQNLLTQVIPFVSAPQRNQRSRPLVVIQANAQIPLGICVSRDTICLARHYRVSGTVDTTPDTTAWHSSPREPSRCSVSPGKRLRAHLSSKDCARTLR